MEPDLETLWQLLMTRRSAMQARNKIAKVIMEPAVLNVGPGDLSLPLSQNVVSDILKGIIVQADADLKAGYAQIVTACQAIK